MKNEPDTQRRSSAGEEEATEASPRQRRGGRLLVAAIVTLVGLGVFGGVGELSGTGWFGYRSWMYEGGELYVLNMNDAPVMASVDGFKAVEVPARNAQRLDLVGGESEVRIESAEGELLETHTITLDGNHALLKVAPGEDCLAVVDIEGFYRKVPGARPIVEQKIDAATRLTIFQTRNVVWPRKPFPPRIDPKLGPARWVEIVGCELFDDAEFLESYLGYRIEEGLKESRQGGARPVE